MHDTYSVYTVVSYFHSPSIEFVGDAEMCEVFAQSYRVRELPPVYVSNHDQMRVCKVMCLQDAIDEIKDYAIQTDRIEQSYSDGIAASFHD